MRTCDICGGSWGVKPYKAYNWWLCVKCTKLEDKAWELEKEKRGK